MRTYTSCPRPVSGRALYNSTTGDLIPVPCNTWACSVCGPAKASRLGILAAAARPERFVTLSKVASDPQTAYKRLTVLSRGFRRSGKGWEYLAVPEAHKNGSWHLHLLQRGDFIPQRELSRRAESAGMGRVCWIEGIQNAGEAVPKYLMKYMTKELPDGEARSKAGKRYGASRGFWPGGLEAHRSHTFGPKSNWEIVESGPYVDPA